MSFKRSCPIALLLCATAYAQPDRPPASIVAGIPANYDEALAGNYTLPDPLVFANGKPVRDAKTWNEKRRPEIVHLFEETQYGRSPGRPTAMTFDVFEKGPAFDGKAIRCQVTVHFSADKAGPKMDLLIYVPAAAAKPVPLLLNLSFSANSNTVNDPSVKEGEVWGPDKKKIPASKGRSFGRSMWSVYSTQGSASQPSTTATSTRTSPAGCHTACALCTRSRQRTNGARLQHGLGD